MSQSLPGSLPRPQRGGYALTVEAMAKATPRDAIAQRCRQTGTTSQTSVDLVWVLKPAQMDTFRAWWRVDLEEGSLPATIRLPNGADDAEQTVQFLGPYTAEDQLGRWRVTVSGELTDPPRLTSSELDAVLASGVLP